LMDALRYAVYNHNAKGIAMPGITTVRIKL
jgi:hypothetical protein